MIKAVIFDCFGVLVGSSLEPFIERHFIDNPDGVAEMRRLDNLANRGTIPWQEFQRQVAALTGLSEKQVWDELDDNPPNLELFEYIQNELKPHYKIGFLSNASDDWMQDLFSESQRAIFDDVVLSFRAGIAKPDGAIFQLSAENLGVLPNECVFVDDIEKYCEGAREVGMQTIQYQNVEDFVRQLKPMLSEMTIPQL